MVFDEILIKNNKFVMLGIGGIGMSALCCFLKQNGGDVFGYDRSLKGDIVRKLQKSGVFVTDAVNELPAADYCIYSDAIPKEIINKVQAGQFISRGNFLGKVLAGFPTSVAICGSHGKTTAVAMLGEILLSSPASVFLGGEYPPFAAYGGWGNFYMRGNAICVAEACEYRKNLLHLNPTVAVALNVDLDHTDCYTSVDEIADCFCGFVSKAPIGVVNADDSRLSQCKNAITFAIEKEADYRAKNIKSINGCYSFDCIERGRFCGRVELSVIGKHQIYNALAVIVAARQLFVPFSIIREKLKVFQGVRRRAEFLGVKNGQSVFADYAHHPREIDATLKAFSETLQKEFSVVFQPHTYSRTRDLFSDFYKVLSKVKHLAICKIFAARETPISVEEEWSLAEKLNAVKLNGKEDLLSYIEKETQEGRSVVILGAGDVYDMAKEITFF